MEYGFKLIIFVNDVLHIIQSIVSTYLEIERRVNGHVLDARGFWRG